MARKVQVLLVDDLDGTDLGTKGETIEFALDGHSYEIDLSDKHAKSLRDAMGQYVEHARRAVKSSGGRRAHSTAAGVDRSETKAARAWLVQNGHLGADSRGRIKGELWELYRNRNQQPTPSPVPSPVPSLAETKGEVPARADSNSTKAEKAAAKDKQPVAV